MIIGCFTGCFYEDDNSECLIKEFKKPKQGHCKGKVRCLGCETTMSEEEYNEGIELCKFCICILCKKPVNN